MAEFTVSDVCNATGGKSKSNFRTEFSGISTDTRTIKSGNLFVALVGEQFDGHNFIDKAIEKGAAGILISSCLSNSYGNNIAIIEVENTLKAYQDIAAYHRNRFKIPVIAITGSNGKTTTKDLTAAVLSSRFTVLKTQANYNNEIGLPYTLLNLNNDHEVAVVEMGMRGLGEIRELAEIARPTMGIVTNVGETHIELLGSVQNIANAKAELVESLSQDGVAILNADNRLVSDMRSKTCARILLYGIESQCDVKADNIRTNELQTRFECKTTKGTFEVVVPAIGRHNVYNALAAIAAGLELGLTFNEIKDGLKSFSPSAMRLSIDKIGPYKVINDAYNASPMSMNAAIDTLIEVAGARSIAVLGDMLELGEFAIEAHRQIGKKLAECGVNVVVTVGECAKHISETAKKSGINAAVSCDSHDQAKEYLQTILKPGDTILIKGSRGMKMEKILEKLM
ncbi:UDP-N-acetylmuramoyl-tripeptide--D-alanyl-D-alanine ligase [Dendrosporobacter sp. 1207_IL3150]|uniref:UDP-N-acetylmuramoyl-tripeptide--D-alanyl-D- alanine ligase n=1 Tax=Dendrosporobacter sp. 1207_IL3150 TaxID=3084054 RepID=UPI002FD9E7B4